jgi:predicted alpha/beta-hydrolase family hydrolase
MLICQGERDPFGKPQEVTNYGLPQAISLHWLPHGDHDFRPLKRSGLEQTDLIGDAAVRAALFIREIRAAQ